MYELTDAGRTEAEERAARDGDAPWEAEGDMSDEFQALIKSAAKMFAAAKQVARNFDGDQMQRATAVIRAASKELYQILSEE